MPNRIQLSGFDELRAELATLPTDARDDAAPIEESHARRAAAAVVAAYPHVTGALRAGVAVLRAGARGIAVRFRVVSSAPHAHLYEFGTYRTRPHAIFLPLTEHERRASVIAVAAMVEAKGLKVTGARD